VARQRSALLRPLSWVGLTVAAFGYLAGLTPSLLPRPLLFLIALTALGTVLWYAIGATAQWLVTAICRRISPAPLGRAMDGPPQGTRWRRLHFVVPVLAWLPAVAFTPIAVTWQAEQQSALAMPHPLPSTFAVLGGTAVLAGLFLLIGRTIRLLSGWLGRVLSHLGPLRRPGRGWIGQAIAAGVLVLVGYLIVHGALMGVIASYAATNESTEGQVPAAAAGNSGSPGSPLGWETLGRQGRFFVDNPMTPADISEISGSPAVAPVRIYVGMQQGRTPQERSDLAVAELDRVSAWSREYLAIVGVTGTGWVDPDAANALEIVTGGDVTTVTAQYSAVPSWIGFLLDSRSTTEQNRALIDTVLRAWQAKPADSRPQLILFGESLGSFGTQAAWQADEPPLTVTDPISRIIWVGPPAESVLWRSYQANRTGGPAWQPVIGDGTVAQVFTSTAEVLTASPATGPRITFVAHPNDPVVYWTPSLFIRKPDWLSPPLGPGVDVHMRWFPLVTGLQVGMDLIVGGGPAEVAHNYTAETGPAIAQTVNPPGWTPQATERLMAALPGLDYQPD